MQGFVNSRTAIVVALILIWSFVGWPRIWNNPPFPPAVEEAVGATVGNARTYYMDSTVASPNQLRTREYASSSGAWGTESSANQTTNTTINNIVVEASPTRDEKLIGVWSDTGTASQSELRVFKWDGSSGDETLIFSTTVGADLGANVMPFDIAYENSSGDALIVYANGGTSNEVSYLTWNGTATSSVSTLELAGTTAAVLGIELSSPATLSSDRIAMIYTVNATTNSLNAAVWSGSGWESNPSTPLEAGAAFLTGKTFNIEFEDVSGELLAVWDTTGADNVFRYNTCTGGPPCTWGTTANSGTTETMTIGDLAPRAGTNELFEVSVSNNGNDTGAGQWNGSAWTVAAGLDTTNGDPDVTAGQTVAAGWLEAGGNVRTIGVYGDAAAAGLDYVQWNGSALSLGTDLCTTGPPATIEKQVSIKPHPFDKSQMLILVKDANADVYGYKLTFDGTSISCTFLNGGVLNANVGVNTNRSFDYDYDRFIPVTNSAPSVSSVNISPDPITLTENGTSTVTITATVTDTNGCGDVLNNGTTTATLYRSGVGASCSQDFNNCYVNIRMASTSCSGTSGDASGTVQIWYIAEATDASSTNSGNTWQATVKAIDAASASSTATDSTPPELSTLLAIDVTGSISYGTVSPSATSTTQTATITNTGNFNSTDAAFSGVALESGANSIAVGNQKYSTTTNEFWDYLDYVLSGTATFRELNIVKATATTSPSTQSNYWAIQVPDGTAAGTYSGTTTIEAY